MNREKYFEVISCINKILSIASAADLEAFARSKNLSNNLSAALKFLAKEAKEHDSQFSSTLEQKPIVDKKIGKNSSIEISTSNQSQADRFTLRKLITEKLSNTNSFPDKESLYKYADDISLKVSRRPKEGRKDAVEKIVSKIFNSDEKTVERAISKLNIQASDQTVGWFKMIRGS